MLLITPIGGGSEGAYSKPFIDALQSLPGARFAIGRPRAIATDITLEGESRRSAPVQMEPCAPREPMLERYNLAAPADGMQPELILSSLAANKLLVGPGDMVRARLGRKTPEGRRESTTLEFRVKAVLPAEASNRRLGLLPLQVLEDIQDYRDVIAVPSRGFAGRTPSAEPRKYASFRLYAENLDAVESLAAHLASRRVDVRTSAKEIASIRKLDEAISRVVWIIAAAVGAGFVAFTASSTQGSIRRKDKMLGMLRLLGFSRLEMMCFPLTGVLLSCSSGTLLVGGLYLAASFGIEAAFLDQISAGSFAICHLEYTSYLAAVGFTHVLSCLSALRASLYAAAIEPSSVIREV